MSDWRTTHGLSKTPEYRAWSSMWQRCTNPKNVRYARYGARGVTICDRWQSFENFLADMGPRPSVGHSVDRNDNDGNYEPSNCRWATRSEQQRNKGGYRADHALPRGEDHWTRQNRERAQAVARQNIRRAHKSGADNGNAKLSQETAEAIRQFKSENPTIGLIDLGRRFGVGKETARKVIKRIAWT